MVTKKAGTASAKSTSAAAPDDPNQLVVVTDDVIADLVHANSTRKGERLVASAGMVTTVRQAAELGITPDQYRPIEGTG